MRLKSINPSISRRLGSILRHAAAAQALVATGALAAACSAAVTTEAPVDMLVLAAPPDMTSAYPPGPYGTDEGSVVRDFLWQGHLDLTGIAPATKVPFGDVSLDQIRRSGARYALVMAGGFW